MTCEIEADNLTEHPGSWHATTEALVLRDSTFLLVSGSFYAGFQCLATLVLLMLLIVKAGGSVCKLNFFFFTSLTAGSTNVKVTFIQKCNSCYIIVIQH